MKKLTPFLIWVMLLLYACVPVVQTSEPFQTRIPFTATVATPTPEAPPETAQQKRERVASELIRAGASANDPESWKKTAEGAAQYEIFGNAGNPAIATDKKLAELDAFMTDLRRADMEQWIATDPEAAKAALAAFARSGLMMNGSPAEADILAATADRLKEFNASLTPKERLLLEVVRRAMAKEEIVLSPVEIIAMETDPNGNVPYAVNVDARDRLIDGAPGYYGMWVTNSEQYIQPGAWNPFDISYTIPVFGRTHFNGKELVRKGALLGDVIWADFVGIAKLPEGKTGAVVLLKDFDGTPYLHTYETVLDTDEPVVIPEGSLVLGTTGPSEKVPYPTIRDVALTTMYAINKANYSEDKSQLTMDVLKQWLEWTPYRVWIESGGVQMMPAGNPSQFFDPENGLMVIGSEVDGLRQGYLFFGTNFGVNGKHPWP